jgi:hypothetical protein
MLTLQMQTTFKNIAYTFNCLSNCLGLCDSQCSRTVTNTRDNKDKRLTLLRVLRVSVHDWLDLLLFIEQIWTSFGLEQKREDKGTGVQNLLWGHTHNNLKHPIRLQLLKFLPPSNSTKLGPSL